MNDVVLHAASHELPLSGVGASGSKSQRVSATDAYIMHLQAERCMARSVMSASKSGKCIDEYVDSTALTPSLISGHRWIRRIGTFRVTREMLLM